MFWSGEADTRCTIRRGMPRLTRRLVYYAHPPLHPFTSIDIQHSFWHRRRPCGDPDSIVLPRHRSLARAIPSALRHSIIIRSGPRCRLDKITIKPSWPPSTTLRIYLIPIIWPLFIAILFLHHFSVIAGGVYCGEDTSVYFCFRLIVSYLSRR